VAGSDPIDTSKTFWPADPVARAAAAAAAGLRRPVPPELPAALAGLVADDPDGRVRAAALGALARLLDPSPEAAGGDPSPEAAGGTAVEFGGGAAAWRHAAADPDPSVRRRAADLAPTFDLLQRVGSRRGGDGRADRQGEDGRDAEGGVAEEDFDLSLPLTLLTLLADREVSVAEAAAWALGELRDPAVAAGAVGQLAKVAGAHDDALVREAAVAALGSLGDPGGLPAVLAACRDKPAIRRRAVLALAAFEGPEVDAALRAALDDKDWQTRQAAEDLLG